MLDCDEVFEHGPSPHSEHLYRSLMHIDAYTREKMSFISHGSKGTAIHAFLKAIGVP